MTSETSPASSLRTQRLWSWLIRGTLATLALGSLVALIAAQGENFEVRFSREVPSSLPPTQIQDAVESVLSWHQWHYITVEARMIDIRDAVYADADQGLMEGARIRFIVEPKQMKHRRFQLIAAVERYVPGKELSLRLVKDSTGRITELFSELRWTLRFEPGTPQGAPGLKPAEKASGTLIIGELSGTTAHWRSRLFGRLSPRILMHQLFYPNLVALAELKQPKLRPGRGSSSFR
jgi:hypothetical protein